MPTIISGQQPITAVRQRLHYQAESTTGNIWSVAQELAASFAHGRQQMHVVIQVLTFKT
jgi:hypothetical protein